MEAAKDAPRTQTTTQGNVATHTEDPGNSSSSSYFNTTKERPAVCMYDVLFHQPSGYDAHLHRDDRQHSKSRGLNVHAEEMARDVPVLSSSEYGRQPRVFVDPSDRQFARVGIVRAEFYRLNGSSLQHTGSCQN
ncbi:cilia- and flagella-associated protein 90-like [Lethenteron reissneri]|uniref:cilia- and flagella-associated protein 90-like n=1 Tax=Lethenteron reissneri TaxID=7753 RepID=UPI002AB7B295|nr:cilia- and flagella-associated protein 90-like [Lethenteron reissneri]XP_061429445.1 cilia- and flagella-associated protein 90-like [Lethenteron reissneri]